MAHNKHSS